MNAFAHTFLLIYAGLFPIVNPIGSAPIFLSLTRPWSMDERNALALRVAVNSFFLLLGSLFVGSHVLEFFGITLPVVRVAGGMVVTAFGWRLLHEGESPPIFRKPDAGGTTKGPDTAFYPLTMPLTVGPGSIAVAITLGSQWPKTAHWADLAVIAGAAVFGLLAMSATIYIAYRFAGRVLRALGDSGTRAVMQLTAFILLCIGVEIVCSGVGALIGHPA
ncbi:MAG TPA: MarC family protein [Rhizomicrobium sp.]